MKRMITKTGLMKQWPLALLLCALLGFSPQAAHALGGGTYTINPAGTASATVYRSIKDAFSDMKDGTRTDGGTSNGSGVSGAVIFELAPGYDDSLETFPLTITSITGASFLNTITIRPAAGVTSPLTIAGGTINLSVFRLDSAKFVTIDGRPGGVGANKYLEIVNSRTAGFAMVLINGASNNIVRYCTITSNAAINYTVLLSTTNSTTGNNNNLFDNCNIGTVPGIFSLVAFYSLGTSGLPNTGNTISNCNVYRFSAQGISATSNNESWTIMNNNVYQPDTVTNPTNNVGIIVSSGSGHQVLYNYIGGTQPRCGGTAWAVRGTGNNAVRGIHLAPASSSTSTSFVQYNTIANMYVESGATVNGASSAFNGIYINSGLVRIENNIIGNDTGNGSITVVNRSTVASGYVYGINSAAFTHHTIRNNTFGAITATATDLTRGVNIYGIRCDFRAGTTSVISGNKIGSTTRANSIYAASAATGQQPVYGISFHAIASTARIAYVNNTIANLTNNSANTAYAATVTGIDVGGSDSMVIKDNAIFNLKNASYSDVIGINTTSMSAPNGVFSNNTIHNLNGATVWGMNMHTSTNGAGTVNANLVHSLSNNSNGSTVYGLTINSRRLVTSNNMVRLGIDADGNSILTGTVRGIESPADSAKMYHNTVYIGGTGVTSGTSSAYVSWSPNGVDVQNNIFVNARSGSGTHFASAYAGTPTGTINNNLIYAPGTGGVLADDGATPYTNLSSWQAAHSFDATSVSADPLFKNATGNAASFDLHLDFNSPAEKTVTAISAATADYDGENRKSFGDMHIGADATALKGVNWTGTLSSDWSNGGNWAGSAVPTATENALIPAGVTNYPNITTGTVNAASLLVAKNARVRISGGTLQLSGIITNNDTIDARGGTIVLKDTFRRNIAAGVLHVANLSVDDTAGVEIKSGKVNVYGTYTPTNGVLTANNNLVLKSDTNGTARIAAGATTGNYIADSITVERYIPGKRVFRFLSHPFNHNIPMSELTDDIDITGAGGAPFTPTVTNNPSAFSFNVMAADNSTTGVNPGWVPFTASTVWYPLQGMRVLVRGAKGEGLNGSNYTPSDVTIDMKGRPYQGNVTFMPAKGINSDFVMLGNPYASAVDMSLTTRSSIGSAYMVWDANMGLNGGYITNSFSTSSILPAGASFFTTITHPVMGNMSFTEASKSSNMTATVFKNTATNHVVELSLEDSTIFWDRLLVHFDSSAMATVDYPDAVKLYNPDMTFYTLSKDDSMLAIDARPFTDKEVIKLGLYSTINKNFKITVPNYSTPAGTKVYLKDNYLNTTQEITGVGYAYWFATSADKKSWGNERFELFTEVTPVGIVEAQPASNLKVKLAPNPASNEVNIYCEGMNGKTATVTIMNMMGVQVAAGNTSTGHLNVPMQQIPAGMYTVTIQCGGQTITQKLIKK